MVKTNILRQMRKGRVLCGYKSISVLKLPSFSSLYFSSSESEKGLIVLTVTPTKWDWRNNIGFSFFWIRHLLVITPYFALQSGCSLSQSIASTWLCLIFFLCVFVFYTCVEASCFWVAPQPIRSSVRQFIPLL